MLKIIDEIKVSRAANSVVDVAEAHCALRREMPKKLALKIKLIAALEAQSSSARGSRSSCFSVGRRQSLGPNAGHSFAACPVMVATNALSSRRRRRSRSGCRAEDGGTGEMSLRRSNGGGIARQRADGQRALLSRFQRL